MEFISSKEYQVICPKELSDIINEGRYLHHCVGSYANKIAKKETIILFLRSTKNKEKSLVTLEIKNQVLCQGKGINNRNLSKNEIEFLKLYCKKKKLKYDI